MQNAPAYILVIINTILQISIVPCRMTNTEAELTSRNICEERSSWLADDDEIKRLKSHVLTKNGLVAAWMFR
jgi:hypothetical protein